MKAMPTIVTNPEVAAAALRHCRVICRKRARNFYYGLKLSPEPQRSALFAIYAWMRGADDLVDGAAQESIAVIRRRIHAFRTATDLALAGRPTDGDPLWIALADVARRFRLPAEHFASMLDGQLNDLERLQYQTFEQLHAYCYRVASTVGLLCIEIWGYDDPAARQLAIQRGIAFQLTNIIRDFKQDYDAGRIYLPLEDFQRHGIDARAMRNWSRPIACHAMMKQQTQRTESYYRESAALEGMIAEPCRPTLWAMTSIYHGLLKKIDRDPVRLVLSRRVRLSAMRKGVIVVQAKWRARGARGAGADVGSATPEVAGLPREVSGNPTA